MKASRTSLSTGTVNIVINNIVLKFITPILNTYFTECVYVLSCFMVAYYVFCLSV